MSAPSLFECRGCGFQRETTWHPALCPWCFRRWDIRAVRTATDRGPDVSYGECVSINDVIEHVGEVKRIEIGGELAPVDRVLGGGLVPGSVILVSGAPGLGKSTLVLATLRNVARRLPVVYFSGEESIVRVSQRAKRLGGCHDRFRVVQEVELEAIKDLIDDERAKVVAIDSVQMIQCCSAATGDALEPGGALAISVATADLAAFAQQEDVAIILIGRVTRDGTTAGPRSGLDHAVDVVLTLSGDPRKAERTLVAEKNRYGATARAEAELRMTDHGLVPVAEEEEVA